MKLLVAIHDVTPALALECRRLWHLCAARGVVPALFVVPNWHGRWPLEDHQGFVRWLQDCSAEGAEIFLHGERHDEVGARRDWRDHVRAAGRTAYEGEFLALDAAAARERIVRGVGALRRAGLAPLGFVAPAWLASNDTYRVVAAEGLRVSEDEFGVRLHHRATTLAAPVVRWSARTALRAATSARVAEWRWRLQRRAPLVRLALHPSDLHSAVTRRSLVTALERWTEARPVWRYAQL